MEREPDTKSFVILSTCHTFVDIYGAFMGPIMPFLAAKIGMSLGLAGLLISISSIASSIMQPLFGYVSDFLSRRFFIFWGIMLASIFFSLSGISTNVWMLGLFMFLGSTGVGFFHPQATTLANYYGGRSLNAYMGIFMACGSIGYALGPKVSSTIVSAYGLNATLWAVIPGLFLALIMYIFLPKIRHIKKKEEEIKFVETMVKIFKEKMLRTLILISSVKSIVIITFASLLPFLYKNMGMSISTIGTVLMSFSITGSIATIVGGRLTKYMSQKAFFLTSLFPVPFFLWASLYSLRISPPLSFILLIMGGFFVLLSVSENITLAQRIVPEHKAAISGIISGFCWGVAGILLTPLAFVAGKVGIIPVLSIIAIMPFISVYSLLMFKDFEKTYNEM